MPKEQGSVVLAGQTAIAAGPLIQGIQAQEKKKPPGDPRAAALKGLDKWLQVQVTASCEKYELCLQGIRGEPRTPAQCLAAFNAAMKKRAEEYKKRKKGIDKAFPPK